MKTIRETNLEIVQLPIENIIAYKNNPRRHSREQIESIKESIEKLGNRKPIEIDENYVIICGHGRLEAYKALEYKTVPVIIHSDMTESEKKAYRIADNEIALKSEWDIDLLNLELKDIDFEMGNLDDLKIEYENIDEINNSNEVGSNQQSKYEPNNCHIQLGKIMLNISPEEQNKYNANGFNKLYQDIEIKENQKILIYETIGELIEILFDE